MFRRSASSGGLLAPIAVALACAGCAEQASPPARLPPPVCPERMAHLPDVGACIDRHEAAIEGRGRTVVAVSAEGRLPENGASWATADRACRNAGLRLCTGAEWQRACAGLEGRTFPYEGEYEPRRCNSIEQTTDPSEYRLAPGGSFERCVTPEGVHDLSGNVGEWIADADATGRLRELRGGSYANPPDAVKCTLDPPAYQPPEVEFRGQGFRCCADARR